MKEATTNKKLKKLENTQMNISSLDELCFDLIFTHLSVTELLYLRRVNHQWKRLIESRFTRIGTLKLFSDKHDFYRLRRGMYERRVFRQDFYTDGLFILRPGASSEVVVRVLIKLFPNIRCLIVSKCKQLFHEGISTMLRQFSSLTDFTCAGLLPNDQLDPDFWTSLNSTKHIQTIKFHQIFNSVIPSDLTFLRRIRTISLAHYRGNLVPFLELLGPNCENIYLTWVYLNSEDVECALKRNPALAESVKTLRLEYIASLENRESNYRRLIQTIVTRFVEITHLDICYGDHLDFAFLFPQLHRLPKLSKLHLYFGNNQLPDLCQMNREIRPLLNMKCLFVETYKLTSSEHIFWIVFMFPNLERLVIRSEPPGWMLDSEWMKENFFVSLSKLQHFNLRVG